MKIFQWKLQRNYIDLFFPHVRIKTKIQVLTILLEATRYLLFNEPVESSEDSKLILYIGKMSRVIFISDTKFYSINFPFNFQVDGSLIHINYKNLIDLDSKAISDLLSILKDNRFNSSNCFDFIEPIYDLEFQYQNNLWVLIRDLLLMEDGYLRFDKDAQGHLKAKAEGKEHIHPENHIDIFYSNNNTFKIGLEKTILDVAFLDYLNTQTDCMYLKPF